MHKAQRALARKGQLRRCRLKVRRHRFRTRNERVVPMRGREGRRAPRGPGLIRRLLIRMARLGKEFNLVYPPSQSIQNASEKSRADTQSPYPFYQRLFSWIVPLFMQINIVPCPFKRWMNYSQTFTLLTGAQARGSWHSSTKDLASHRRTWN